MRSRYTGFLQAQPEPWVERSRNPLFSIAAAQSAKNKESNNDRKMERELPIVNNDSPTETQSERVQIWIIDSRE